METGKRIAGACSILIAGGFLAGCETMKVAGVSKSSESEKNALVKKVLTYSVAHYMYNIASGQQMWGDPKLDHAALKKVKKVAILRFGVQSYSGTTETGGNGVNFTYTASFDGNWQPFAGKAYDQMKTAFEQNGIDVIPADAVTSNAAYKAFEIDKPAGYQFTAYALRDFAPATSYVRKGLGFGAKEYSIGNATRFQKLGKALGVDAVMLIVGDIGLDASGVLWFSKLHAKLPGYGGKPDHGLMVDMFSADEPKLIWSACTKKDIVVPITSKKDLMNDFLNSYNEVAQLVAHKLKLDMDSN